MSTRSTWPSRRSCSAQGEALFEGIDLRALGYRTVEHVPTDRATHIVLAR